MNNPLRTFIHKCFKELQVLTTGDIFIAKLFLKRKKHAHF